MDTLSHGLYGGGLFGRKSKKDFFTAFFFGVMPDIFSFGPYFVLMILGFLPMEDYSSGAPSSEAIPLFVHALYQVTHSFVIYTIVLATLIWFGRKGLAKLTLGWPLHILVNIPTHTHEFFPTPFLWPMSDVTFNGVSWATPWIFVPNVIIICLIYAQWYLSYRRKKKVGVL